MGNIPISSRWDGSSSKTTNRSVQFELPWAQFIKSSKVVEEAASQPQRPPTSAEESIIPLEQPAATPAPLQDTQFTLRAGSKRKAPAAESGSESGEVDETPSKPESSADPGAEEIDVPSSDSSEEERRMRKLKKLEKKARKREAKKLAKRAEKEAAANAAKEEDEGEEPFDYSKAQSVLNASRTANGVPQTTKFNPYGMTVDGPKPARKMHGEKPGKSATFRK